MRLWRSQLSRAQKIEKFTDILQNQVDCRLVRKFLPNLASNFFHLKIGEHITNKRITEYQREFIHQLQKQILQRKIQKSFNRKRLFELKKTILIELRIHAMENKRIRRNITDHLNEVEQESNLDILQIAFNSLKEKVVIGKFKAISTHCNRLKTCKKVFFAL